MSYLYGTQARIYGIQGSIKVGGNTVWPTYSASTAAMIVGYTFTPSMEGGIQGFNQFGVLKSEAFAYHSWEMQINFEIGASSKATIQALILPAMMTTIELEGMDNADLTGTYNYIAGSWTGSNQGWKTGTMTLRAIEGSDGTSANKVALSAIS